MVVASANKRLSSFWHALVLVTALGAFFAVSSAKTQVSLALSAVPAVSQQRTGLTDEMRNRKEEVNNVSLSEHREPEPSQRKLTIDVCISAIERDLNNGCLYKSLESIRVQTARPKSVILVVSNTTISSHVLHSKLATFVRPIQLKVLAFPKRLMQSQGRNIAVAHSTSDIVSFIDADDFSHPQRLETLLQAFLKEKKLRLCLHEFAQDHTNMDEWYSELFNSQDLIAEGTNALCEAELRTRGQPHLDLPVHHAHVTVRREVFRNHLFDETTAAYRIEDSLFVRDIIAETCNLHSIGDLQYIKYPLTFYTTSREQCGLAHTLLDERVSSHRRVPNE